MKLITKLLQKHSNWVQPKGYDTGIKIYNCVAKDKVPLIVKNKNFISWYTCGPTVYDSAHIGHASCYVKLDIIQRILRTYFKLNLVTVMNITDVDDKILKKSAEQNKHPTEISKKYEIDFWVDLAALNVLRPNCILRVTENMPIIVNFIRKLLNQDAAYESNGSIYFQVDKYEGYNKLQGSGSIDKTSDNNKKSEKDFALWKNDSTSELHWKTDWGSGRPGWHIECSAMASAVFGSSIDFHAGGIDLRFPHHENEEAQSCCYHQKEQWVNYWIHAGHLMDKNSMKMSKSLKNGITIGEMLQQCNGDANVFRTACLMTSYRQPMQYSSELLKTAAATLSTFKSFLQNCSDYTEGVYPNANVDENILMKNLNEVNFLCHNALCNDFDTAEVIKIIISLIRNVNKMLHSNSCSQDQLANDKSLKICSTVIACKTFVIDILSTFGLNLTNIEVKSDDDADKIMDILINFRENIRSIALDGKNKELLMLCDEVRNSLKIINVNVKDHGKKSSWSR